MEPIMPIEVSKRIQSMVALLNHIKQALQKYVGNQNQNNSFSMMYNSSASTNGFSGLVFNLQFRQLINLIEKQLTFQPGISFLENFHCKQEKEEAETTEYIDLNDQKMRKQQQEEIVEIYSNNNLFSKNEHQQSQNNVNLVDFYILDFDCDKKEYQIYGEKTSKIQQGSRSTIRDLLFSSVKDHMRTKQRTPSMTQIHKLTSNPSVVKKPIILPSFQNKKPRYTYIFQTEECISIGLNYMAYDRYYCFVFDNLVDQEEINNIMKRIRSKVFENRFVSIGEVQDVDCYKVKKSFEQNLQQLFTIIEEKPLQISKFVSNHSENFFVTSDFLSYSSLKHVNLLLALFYFMVKEQKIILLGNKEQKHIISEIMLDLFEAIKPLEYIYPIMQGTLTTSHCQFLSSPMPMLIGVWGSQKRYKKMKGSFQKQLNQIFQAGKSQQNLQTKDPNENQLFRIIIDLQQMQIIGTKISLQDCYVLDKMQKYVFQLQDQLKTDLIRTIQQFIKGILKNQITLEEEWFKLVKTRLFQTQMYEFYKNSGMENNSKVTRLD